MPGTGVDSRDHPVFGDLAGDLPPPVGPVIALGGLHVLPGHQRQQRQRRGGLLVQLRVLEHIHQRVRVVDQDRDQRVPRAGVVPVDLRLARRAVIMARAHGRDLLRRTRHGPRHPAHRGDQLGDRALGSHRIGQDRGVHSRRRRPFSTTVCSTTFLTASLTRCGRSDFAIRLRRHQGGRVEPRVIQARADRGLPPHVEPDAQRSPGPNSHPAPPRSSPRPSA